MAGNDSFQNSVENHLHIEVYGTGRPLVLVHGWSMHTGIWRDFAQNLAEKFRVICIDLPGHGCSKAIHPFTLQRIGEVLLQAVPDEPCCWLGWSLGASVVLEIAHCCPERVESVVLAAGNPRFVSDKEWPGMPVDLLEAFSGNLENNCQSTLLRFLGLQVQGLPNARTVLSGMKKNLDECELPDGYTLIAGLEILKNTDLRAKLQRIDKPVMLVLGEKDLLVPVAAGAAIQRLKPAAEVHVIEGSGHVPFVTHRKVLIDIVSNFYKSR